MTTDEKGYIQFKCEWEPVDAVQYHRLPELIYWRRLLSEERLVGVDGQGVGYGNLSERIDVGGSFIITATQTGHLKELDASHFAIVTDLDVSENRVRCKGAIKASSESLSHGILYQADAEVGAVVHVHDAGSWRRLYGRIPTTDPSAEAGTTAMADAIASLLGSTDLRETRVLVMGGHKDGLISFGGNIAEAGSVMLKACDRNLPARVATLPAIDE